MEIQFYHVGGACFVIQVDGKLKIACDPVLCPVGTEYQFKSFSSKRVTPPIYEDDLFDDVNLWLITHVHEDHIDQQGISKISESSTVITHKKAVPLLNSHSNVRATAWNESLVLQIEGYRIEVCTVPAFHGNNIVMRKLVGSVNGYFIKIIKNGEMRTIYITSDTVLHNRIISTVAKLGSIDLMVANLGEVQPDKFGGPLTMSVLMLLKMKETLRPLKVIPIHIDDFSHYTTNPKDLTSNKLNILDRGCWIKVI